LVRRRQLRVGLGKKRRVCSERPSVDNLTHSPSHRVMNEQPSPVGRNDDDRPSSPKRKKVRQKYAPKACMSRL
jgi:hypothetical protein